MTFGAQLAAAVAAVSIVISLVLLAMYFHLRGRFVQVRDWNKTLQARQHDEIMGEQDAEDESERWYNNANLITDGVTAIGDKVQTAVGRAFAQNIVRMYHRNEKAPDEVFECLLHWALAEGRAVDYPGKDEFRNLAIDACNLLAERYGDYPIVTETINAVDDLDRQDGAPPILNFPEALDCNEV